MSNVERLFDFGNIQPEHKKVVEEVIKIANSTGNEMFAELLKIKFQIKEIPTYNLDESEFVKLCKETNLTYVVQGHTLENIDGKEIKYPIVSVCEDIRKLDNIIKVAKEK